MNMASLIDYFAGQPIIESASVITLVGDAEKARVQISRWVRAGKLIKLRRGYYILAPSYRKHEPDQLYIANAMNKPSYVSLSYVLSYYGLIPEAVPVLTSVSTGRTESIVNSVGRFEYRHISPKLMWGFETLNPLSVTPVQLATPEKALLDMIYLTPGSDEKTYFESLRLQHLDVLDLKRLADFAERFGKPKIKKALKAFNSYKSDMEKDEEEL